MKSKIFLFDKRPHGIPSPDCFKLAETAVTEPTSGEVLLKAHYISVDPYLRGRMREGKSYARNFVLGEPIQSNVIAEVIRSANPAFEPGEFVNGRIDWAEYQLSDGTGLIKVDPDVAPLSAYLGILGMPGLTAYLGLMEIGRPQPGETIVVSGAAGAVGSVAGQIGKIMGCRVIGIAGGETKTSLIKNEFGFNEAINYKTSTSIREAIERACPDGVDIYFDNVGGYISDGVVLNINKFARIIICGAISHYNDTEIPMGPRLESILLTNSALMKGFIVGDYSEKFPHAMGQLTHWLLEGRLIRKETIVEGFTNLPHAFIGLFEGKNTGKMVVKI